MRQRAWPPEQHQSTKRRGLGFALMLVSAGCLPGALSACYFTDLAAGQLALVNRQRRLPMALAAERDQQRRELLALVPDVRSFATTVMQLRPGANYTGYFSTEADAIVHVLSASEKTRLAPHGFWFPVVGQVEYESFFDEGAARGAERELQAAGYDTWVAPATAYSTLGFFRDPVTSVMMRRGEVAFVEVLLHEMAHARLFVPGATEWNEQLASFVGRTGVVQYYRSRFGRDARRMAELERHLAERARLEAATAAALAELETLYASGEPEAAVLRRREHAFARVSRVLAEQRPEEPSRAHAVNNARLLHLRRYRAGSPEISRLWAQAEGSWVRFWPLCERYAGTL